MKQFSTKLLFLAAFLLFGADVMAQVPQGFNFQAVARNADGDLISNSELGVRVTVLQGTEDGTAVYTEVQKPTTSAVGSFLIVIGEGTSEDDFSAIDWSSDNYYVKLEIDPSGGEEYEELGTTRLLSVPYALLAKDVVNGGTGSGELVTNYELNTADGDTAFQVQISGEGASETAIIGRAATTGTNVGVEGKAFSESANTNLQVGTYGEAVGDGTGTHLGVYGIAFSPEGTGGRRYGLYGSANSQGRENIGGFGIGQGSGDGEVVALGDENIDGEFNVGGFNIGLVGFARNNLNGNIGIRGYVYGAEGGRENRAVSAEAVSNATGRNVGVQSIVHSSQTDNMAFQVLMFDNGSGNSSLNNIGVQYEMSNAATEGNYGMRGFINGASPNNVGADLYVGGGENNTGMILNVNGETGSNIGMTVNAPTAAELNGNVIIDGDLSVTGSINGAMGEGGSANGSTLDSLFLSTVPEAEFQRNTSFYPGFIRNSDQDGNFVNLSRTRLQYGNDADENIYNWYDKGSMQLAAADYANGERATGMGPGNFYMDIYYNGSFYAPLNFGIGNAAEGGKAFFSMSSLTRAENQQGDLFSINISEDPNGNDANGQSSQVMMYGTNSPNIQMGGQSWENNDLPFFQLFGNVEDGNGWYLNNTYLGVATDGTDEWASLSLMKTNIVGQTSQETILLDGYSGNINISGSLSQSSDERLKKDIKTIENALDKTNRLRGVTYTWKTDVHNEDPQIGVIAQEVEKVFPEFVLTDEDGMKSVNYAQMTAVLIEAVKELNAKISDLEKENKVLTAQVDKKSELEQRLAQIEKMLGVHTEQQVQPSNTKK